MQPIPTYALYGENLENSYDDILHFEQLRTRSAKHNWSIKAHKHDTLWQLFYFETPGTIIRLNGTEIFTSQPIFVAIPPLCVHAFQFPQNAIGGAISIRFPVLHGMLEDLPESNFLTNRWCILKKENPAFRAAKKAYQNLVANFSNMDQLRNQALRADIMVILIAFIRQTLETKSHAREVTFSQRDDQLRQFCKLVEDNFRSNWPTERYASAIDISTASLNRKCRNVLGYSPQRFLAKRRILEAKRLLKFSRLSVSEIADDLGYSDTSYFCRSFKKMTSLTPAKYRRESAA
jgi:AraC family transcriptional activator of pobA